MQNLSVINTNALISKIKSIANIYPKVGDFHF